MDENMKRRHIWTNMATMDSLAVLFLMYSMCCTGLVDGLTITLNKNAVRNSDLQILITTSSISSAVFLTKPGGSSDNCAAPLFGPGLCTSLDLSQDLTTGVTTYSITSLVRSTDEGTWTASHGVSDTNTIDIKVLTIPTLTVTQTVSTLTLSSSNTQSLTITATCAYPAVSLDLYFVPTGEGTAVSSPSSTATCTSTGNAGCADTDAESYDCIIVPKLETSLTAGTYHVQFVVNLAGQYEPIGLNSTITDTVITIEASSSICDSCTTINVLAVLGIVFAVVCIVFCWMSHFRRSGKFQGPCSVFINSKCSVKQTLIAAIIATSLCVIGIILCIVGLVTLIVALAAVGFVLPVVLIVIILLTIFCGGKITEKDGGQTIITPVYVQSNAPVTLTCPADDKATTLTWTGPGGIPYVTGTTVEAGLSGSVKRRISARHEGGSYTQTFTKFLPSDMGIYTSEVDGIVVTQIVIVQDNKAVRARPDGQEGSRPPIDTKPGTERTPRSACDGSNDTPRRKLEAVPPGSKLLEPLEVNETKKLKKKKKRRSKEDKAQLISGNSDNEQSDAQYVSHQVSDMSPPSGTQLRETGQTDHSITRQEPGYEEKEGQTVDSHTNKTRLQDTQGQADKESTKPDIH